MTEPASIRYKNPGAMWGRTGKRPSSDREVPTNYALAVKWGSTTTVYLNDGLGQGNNIAVFPTYVQGICAQIELWHTERYFNKRFEDAITIWSGGNYVESYISFVTSRVPGMTRNTVMNDAFWRGPMAIPFLKAQAWHEAGKKYPAPDADWIEAQQRVMGGIGAVQPPAAPIPPKPIPPPPDIQLPPPASTKGPLTAALMLLLGAIGSAAAAIKSHPNWTALAVLLAVGAGVAIVIHHKRKSQ